MVLIEGEVYLGRVKNDYYYFKFLGYKETADYPVPMTTWSSGTGKAQSFLIPGWHDGHYPYNDGRVIPIRWIKKEKLSTAFSIAELEEINNHKYTAGVHPYHPVEETPLTKVRFINAKHHGL